MAASTMFCGLCARSLSIKMRYKRKEFIKQTWKRTYGKLHRRLEGAPKTSMLYLQANMSISWRIRILKASVFSRLVLDAACSVSSLDFETCLYVFSVSKSLGWSSSVKKKRPHPMPITCRAKQPTTLRIPSLFADKKSTLGAKKTYSASQYFSIAS